MRSENKIMNCARASDQAVSVRSCTCSDGCGNRRKFASLEPPSVAPEGGAGGGKSSDYCGCGCVAAAIRHGVSSSMRLMGCPLAILVSTSLR